MDRQTTISLAVGAAAVGAAWYLFSRRRVPSGAHFDIHAFNMALDTKTLGRQFEFRNSVTSTMTVLKDEVQQQGPDASHGMVIVADEQTKGVGRRDRGWVSESCGNIYMSFAWTLPDSTDMMAKVEKMLQLNFACGIAVAKAARALGVDAKVKWPNDVWVNNSKLSGSIVDFDGLRTGIAGVGVNVNQSRKSLDKIPGDNKGTSLLCETGGSEIPRADVAAGMLNEIESLMDGTMAATIEEYKKFDMLIGGTVRVCHKSREEADDADYDARVTGFADDGRLEVMKEDDHSTHLLSGEEISIKPAI